MLEVSKKSTLLAKIRQGNEKVGEKKKTQSTQYNGKEEKEETKIMAGVGKTAMTKCDLRVRCHFCQDLTSTSWQLVVFSHLPWTSFSTPPVH
jgi:hypothetical protein